MMKCLKGIPALAVAFLVMTTASALAQGTAGGGGGGAVIPRMIGVSSPFEGTVLSITSTSLSIKGKVDDLSTLSRSNPISRPQREAVRFSIKGATLTRDGKPCEAKDVQKGDAASVKFTIKDRRTTSLYLVRPDDKLIASEIAFTTKNENATNKAKDGEKKPDKN